MVGRPSGARRTSLSPERRRASTPLTGAEVRLFAESEYFDVSQLRRWAQVVHRVRMRNKGALFALFAQNMAVNLGSQACAVLCLGMQRRFEAMAAPIADSVCKLVELCVGKGVPVMVTQHADPAASDPRQAPGAAARFWSASKRLPYALCVQRGQRDWELLPAVAACLLSVGLAPPWVVETAHPSALRGTPVLQRLREFHVDTVLVCGAMLNVLGASTARQLHAHGFRVIILHDASASAGADLHLDAVAGLRDWGLARSIPAQEVMRAMKALPMNAQIRAQLCGEAASAD